MIAVDTSALMAIMLGEPLADDCDAVLEANSEVLISAATMTEALIVAARRGRRDLMAQLIDRLAMSVEPVNAAAARAAADAYDRWGKGVHPASLNILDCFAYALAASRGCPLLYVGNDFAATDIRAARPER